MARFISNDNKEFIERIKTADKTLLRGNRRKEEESIISRVYENMTDEQKKLIAENNENAVEGFNETIPPSGYSYNEVVGNDVDSNGWVTDGDKWDGQQGGVSKMNLGLGLMTLASYASNASANNTHSKQIMAHENQHPPTSALVNMGIPTPPSGAVGAAAYGALAYAAPQAAIAAAPVVVGAYAVNAVAGAVGDFSDAALERIDHAVGYDVSKIMRDFNIEYRVDMEEITARMEQIENVGKISTDDILIPKNLEDSAWIIHGDHGAGSSEYDNAAKVAQVCMVQQDIDTYILDTISGLKSIKLSAIHLMQIKGIDGDIPPEDITILINENIAVFENAIIDVNNIAGLRQKMDVALYNGIKSIEGQTLITEDATDNPMIISNVISKIVHDSKAGETPGDQSARAVIAQAREISHDGESYDDILNEIRKAGEEIKENANKAIAEDHILLTDDSLKRPGGWSKMAGYAAYLLSMNWIIKGTFGSLATIVGATWTYSNYTKKAQDKKKKAQEADEAAKAAKADEADEAAKAADDIAKKLPRWFKFMQAKTWNGITKRLKLMTKTKKKKPQIDDVKITRLEEIKKLLVELQMETQMETEKKVGGSSRNLRRRPKTGRRTKRTNRRTRHTKRTNRRTRHTKRTNRRSRRTKRMSRRTRHTKPRARRTRR